MGIKNLLKFFSEYPELIKEKQTNDFFGKRIAIDISILMYQVVIAIRNSGSDLTNEKGEITSHILGLFNKSISFLERGIIPVYVFDGKPPILKQKILEARKLVRKRALEKLSDAQTEFDKIKYLKRSVSITKEQVDQCKELLQYMGIPFIEAPEEADSQLAYLCKTNMVYTVLTEDMDILTFGSPRIIRNLTSSKKTPVEIELEEILTRLDLTQEQFVDLCILFGCDYCQTIIDLKPKQIYEIYYKYKSIDKTINELRNMGLIIDDLEYKEAKQYFLNFSHEETTIEELKLVKPNNDKLLELLVGKYGLIKFRVMKKLEKLQELFSQFENY